MTPHTGCCNHKTAKQICLLFRFSFSSWGLSRTPPPLPLTPPTNVHLSKTHSQVWWCYRWGGGRGDFRFIRRYLIWKHLSVLGDVSSPRGTKAEAGAGDGRGIPPSVPLCPAHRAQPCGGVKASSRILLRSAWPKKKTPVFQSLKVKTMSTQCKQFLLKLFYQLK